MPVLRLNAAPSGLALHGSHAHPHAALLRAAEGDGPIIVMIHGFKYQPGHTLHCPHRTLFSPVETADKARHMRWLRHLGFGTGHSAEGLAVAFGWPARGTIWDVARRAAVAGQHLAGGIATLKAAAPHRPVHLISHSMGSELALEALHHLPRGAVARVLTLNAASYQSRALAALKTQAGQAAELINVISGENDLFDGLYEWLIAPPARGDRAMGAGLTAPNAVNVQIDCPDSLSALTRFGGHIAPPQRRVCHWSGYKRPGLLRFYRTCLLFTSPSPRDRTRSRMPSSP